LILCVFKLIIFNLTYISISHQNTILGFPSPGTFKKGPVYLYYLYLISLDEERKLIIVYLQLSNVQIPDQSH